LVSRVRKAFGVELPVRQLFATPTVRALAASIDELRGEARRPGLPPLVPQPRDGELPLSFAQERLWFIDQLVPGLAGYNIPGLIQLDGTFHAEVFEQALNEVVRRHEVLRTSYLSVEGRPVQSIAARAAIAFPLIDFSRLDAVDREPHALRAANAAARRSFRLSEGPLLRALLMRLDREQHMLALVLHHIITDMWARDLVIRELWTIYDDFAQGRPSSLPEPEIQYADFTLWQRSWLHGELLDHQLAYWLRELEGADFTLELPQDRPRKALQDLRGARVLRALSQDLSDRIRKFSLRCGVTPYVTMLAALKMLLHCHTGQTDLAIGTPIANRHHLELENLFGFLVNMLVMRTRMGGDPAVGEILNPLQNQIAESFA
ncbi:MAG: non-ribosomal peptide synthetase, partial [Bosea sp.]|uniref:condensation domain-containing protein n=1 Tax=Bosea sp. (in: a-proteobacteria) TaxID=1871050 RepID=UPI0031FE5D9F|nr:non-ribosomal peptide synthetase [Bosea sp. (in: a-proteobacteria)]